MKESITELIQWMNSVLSNRKGSADSEREVFERQMEEISRSMLEQIDDLSDGIKKHYNSIVYNVDNGTGGIKQYDARSVLREIIQNIVDCDYEDEIKVSVSFNDMLREIVFQYNEKGFRLCDLISFFSLEHTGKTKEYAGAFGIGAKGALLNAEYMEVQSVYAQKEYLQTRFRIATKEQSKKRTLEIEELQITMCDESKASGTTLKISLQAELYGEIKKNLLSVDGKEKGKFITPLDFVFAAIKKTDKNGTGTRISFAIDSGNTLKVECQGGSNEVTFTCDGVGVKFNVYTSKCTDYQYVFMKERIRCEEMPAYTNHRYNYFSTYELIGAFDEIEKRGIKFWINIPTLDANGEAVVTNDRTGIEPKKQGMVKENIKKDCCTIIEEYGKKGELFFDIKERCSYMLIQLYDIADSRFPELKEPLCNNVCLKTGDTLVKLRDMFFTEDSEEHQQLIKKVEQHYFVLYRKYTGMKRGYVNSSKDEIDYSFNIYFGGNYLTSFLQNKEWKRDEEGSPKLRPAIDILNKVPTGDSQHIYFMAVLGEVSFSENTLVNLLKACREAYRMNQEVHIRFCAEKKCITLWETEYCVDFEIRNLNAVKEGVRALYASDQNDVIKKLVDFICHSYRASVYEGKELPEVLQEYKRQGFKFSFAEDSTLLAKVEIKEGYGVNEYVIDRICVDSMEYSNLVNLIGLTNYRWFLHKKLDEHFRIISSIEEYYGFNIEDIRYYANRDDVTLANFYVGASDYNLGDKDLVMQIKNNFIEYITEDFKYIDYQEKENSEFIFLPATKKNRKIGEIKRSCIANFLDGIWNTECIKNLYREIVKPITKINAQISYTMKPLVNITEEEIRVIENYLRFYTQREEKRAKAFVVDINTKLYGYSTRCPLCGFRSDSPRAFLLSEKMEYYENSSKFQIDLFLCANEWYESESWIIQEVRFMDSNYEYSRSFRDWIADIEKNKIIDKYGLRCKMRITRMYRDALFDMESQMVENHLFEREMTLTPAMAVRWYTNNRPK